MCVCVCVCARARARARVCASRPERHKQEHSFSRSAAARHFATAYLRAKHTALPPPTATHEYTWMDDERSRPRAALLLIGALGAAAGVYLLSGGSGSLAHSGTLAASVERRQQVERHVPEAVAAGSSTMRQHNRRKHSAKAFDKLRSREVHEAAADPNSMFDMSTP